MIAALSAKDSLLIAPVAMTNSQTATAVLDTSGADWATIRIGLSARLNTNAVAPTINLTESDTTTASTNTITADRSESCASAHALIYRIDTRARKRYLTLSITTATTTNDNVTVSAFGTLGRLSEAPKNTTASVGSTNDAVVVVA